MNPSLDWGTIDLVVFDLDGTLYDLQRLRRRMLTQLLADAARSRSLHTLRVLRCFRQVREALADEGAEFAAWQYVRTANLMGCEAAQVQALVQRWIEREPLRLLRACRWRGVGRLFEDLRAAGKTIAVWSDYPAADKLAALQLQADVVVSADDDAVGRLKPDPRGLVLAMQRAGVLPARTLMVGDRFERDAVAAQRAGAQVLLRAARPQVQVASFGSYRASVFAPLRQRPALVPV